MVWIVPWHGRPRIGRLTLQLLGGTIRFHPCSWQQSACQVPATGSAGRRRRAGLAPKPAVAETDTGHDEGSGSASDLSVPGDSGSNTSSSQGDTSSDDSPPSTSPPRRDATIGHELPRQSLGSPSVPSTPREPQQPLAGSPAMPEGAQEDRRSETNSAGKGSSRTSRSGSDSSGRSRGDARSSSSGDSRSESSGDSTSSGSGSTRPLRAGSQPRQGPSVLEPSARHEGPPGLARSRRSVLVVQSGGSVRGRIHHVPQQQAVYARCALRGARKTRALRGDPGPPP